MTVPGLQGRFSSQIGAYLPYPSFFLSLVLIHSPITVSSVIQSQVSLGPSPQGRRSWKISHKLQWNLLLICVNDFGDTEVCQRCTVVLRRASQKRWYLSRVLDDGGALLGSWEAACANTQRFTTAQQAQDTWVTGETLILSLVPFRKIFLSSCAISLGRWDFYKRALASALGDDCHFFSQKIAPEE